MVRLVSDITITELPNGSL